MGELMVNPDKVFEVAHALSNQAHELREQLQQLSYEWAGLSHTWSGAAASAYVPVWDEWHEGAVKLAESLVDRSDRLARAAVAYEQQDGDSAAAVGSAGSQI